MLNKKIIVAVSTAIMSLSLYATNTKNNDGVKQAYFDGIKDTISFLTTDMNRVKKEILDGYVILSKINNNISKPEILKYEILGYKLGMKPIVIDNSYVVFGKYKNSKKAYANLKKLTNFNIPIKPYVKNFSNEEHVVTPIVSTYKCNTNITITVKQSQKYQVVNKILTLSAFNKIYHRNCKQLFKSAKKVAKIQNRVAHMNKKMTHIPPSKDLKKKINNGNFKQISTIIWRYGVIYKNKLKIGNIFFKEGNSLGKYTLIKIIDKAGIIVLMNNKNSIKSVKIKSKR